MGLDGLHNTALFGVQARAIVEALHGRRRMTRRIYDWLETGLAAGVEGLTIG